MPLTPLDIESQHFKREVLGYSRREVDAALRSAADALS
ncbi:DivIVA domain-containing protein, partial [bacterium]|nr:DivIVA domain-containing protein [bacterium]